MSDIISREQASLQGMVGEILTMKNGERWFHPYNGGAPFRLAKSEHSR